MDKTFLGLTYLTSFVAGAVGFAIIFVIMTGWPIVSYTEKDGVMVKESFENVEISSSSDTIYVRDEWKKDSLRIKKEIFETKMNIHSCENVLSTMNDLSNLEYYIEKVEYEKSMYQSILDSLKSEEIKIMNDSLRRDSKDIDYIKTTCVIIENRK